MTVVVTESGGNDSGEQVADAVETVVEELGEVVSDAVEELTDVVTELANVDDPPAPIVAPVAAAPEIDYDRIVSGVADELERREKERESNHETPDDVSAIEDDEPPEHGSFLYRSRTGQ
jgi:hypothetical protein